MPDPGEEAITELYGPIPPFELRCVDKHRGYCLQQHAVWGERMVALAKFLQSFKPTLQGPNRLLFLSHEAGDDEGGIGI